MRVFFSEIIINDLFVYQDLRVYLSEEENFTDFHNPSALVWHANQIHLGDWSDEREKAVEIAASVVTISSSFSA